jgi:alcohol dehydrogenase class IV
MSVIVNSPSVFRRTAELDPGRHLESAGWLGADITDAADDDAGEVLAGQIIALMRATDMPNGLAGVGYGADDIEALTAGSLPQRRLLDNAPIEIDAEMLAQLYAGAISYW